MNTKKHTLLRTLLLGTLLTGAGFGTLPTASASYATDHASEVKQAPPFHEEKLHMTKEWDKVFPQDEEVAHEKVTFHNRFGITLAADVYKPKAVTKDAKLAAIAVAGPFGAVKEQSSGLYAQTMAKNGFLTIAFDPSFTGESGGNVRDVASLDINTEDFSAAVDYLSNRADVDPERIGLLGICGWGGLAINDTAMDTRVKATVASTMYDMHRFSANGYFDQKDSEEARYETKKALNEQRTIDYRNGTYAKGAVNIDPVPDDAPQFVKDYHAYYKEKRGYHPRAVNSTVGWNMTSKLSLMNTPILAYADEIRTPVLVIHGADAHSRYFGEEAYQKLTSGEYAANKELLIVPGARHTDLYDTAMIPFDKITSFFQKYLK